MGMYISRPPLIAAKDLYQGDVLRGVPVGFPPTKLSYAFKPSPDKIKFATPEQLAAEPAPEGLRLCIKVERIDALVLSPTCDNARGTEQVLLARLKPFTHKDGATDAEIWRAISGLATGTSDPKSFYLPPHAESALPRSEAKFTLLHTIEPEALDRCIAEAKMQRVIGLSQEATNHLQWALALFLGRNAREDLAWPAPEDLKYRRAWLQGELNSKDSDQVAWAKQALVELDAHEAELGQLDMFPEAKRVVGIKTPLDVPVAPPPEPQK